MWSATQSPFLAASNHKSCSLVMKTTTMTPHNKITPPTSTTTASLCSAYCVLLPVSAYAAFRTALVKQCIILVSVDFSSLFYRTAWPMCLCTLVPWRSYRALSDIPKLIVRHGVWLYLPHDRLSHFNSCLPQSHSQGKRERIHNPKASFQVVPV